MRNKNTNAENQILSIQSIKHTLAAIKEQHWFTRSVCFILAGIMTFSLVPAEAYAASISNSTETSTEIEYIDVLLGADALSSDGVIQLTDAQINEYTYETDSSVASLFLSNMESDSMVNNSSTTSSAGGSIEENDTNNSATTTSTVENASKVESTEENTSIAITTVSNTEESTKEAAEEDTEENTENSTVVVSELNAEPSILSAQTGVKVDVTGTDIRDIINIGTETSGKDPTDVDLSEEQGVRDAFINWYEANLKQEFVQVPIDEAETSWSSKGAKMIYDGSNVWGIATSDEFLPSVVMIYDEDGLKYYLAWLFESMSGCGTEYKASDDEYYEKLSRGNQGIDLYALGGQYYYFPGYGTSTAQSNWHTVDIDNSHYNLILNDGHQYLAGNPDHPEWPGIGIPVSGWKIDEIHGLMYHYDMNGDGVFDENDITDINGDGTLDEYEQEGIGLSPWYACWQVSLIKDNIVATSGVAADWYKTYGSVSLKEYEPSATSPDGVKGYDDTGKYIDELKFTAQRVIRNENGEETDEQYQYRIYNTKRKTYSWYGNLRGRNNAGLSNYVTGQSDMYNAKRTHLGAKIVLWNVDEQDWHYYIPRFVWNKYGGTITSSGFPRDTAYKASEIANPLGGLYEASRIYYGRPWYWNSTVKAGTVNKDWLEKWDTSSLTDLVTKASKDGQECFIYSKLPGQGDKEYKILNRNHPEAAKLLSLLITMEVVYGASEKNEYWYDLETTDPNSKRAHEYRSINYSDDGMVSSGWDEFIKTAKAKSKFSKAGPKYYYGTCTAEDLAKCATEEEKNMLMDAYLSCNAFIFLNLAAVTGYPGDLFHSNGYVEGSNYIKFTMCNESKYYKSGGCGKITYVKQELSGVTPVSITRDTVLSGAENIESGESVLDEEYYKTGLWKLKDDESIDGQIQSLLGVSRESWHELSETGDYYGETPSHLSSIYDKLNSLSKEDFESIFEFVDPEATAYEMSGGRIASSSDAPTITVGEVYVLQSSIYTEVDISPGSAADEDGNLPENFIDELKPAIYNTDMRIAFGTAVKNSGDDDGANEHWNLGLTTMSAGKFLATNSSFLTKQENRYVMQKAFNMKDIDEANAEHNTASYLKSLKEAGVTLSGLTVGQIDALKYAVGGASKESPMEMWETISDGIESTTSIGDKKINIKTFRNIFPCPVTDENKVQAGKTYALINVSLIDLYDETPEAKELVFSNNSNEERNTYIIDTIYNLYTEKLDELIEAETKIKVNEAKEENGGEEDPEEIKKDLKEKIEETKTDSDKTSFISGVQSYISHAAFVEVLGCNYSWLFNNNTDTEDENASKLVVNISDNNDGTNDYLTIRYLIKKQSPQKNLSITYLKIYEYNREEPNGWNEIVSFDESQLSAMASKLGTSGASEVAINLPAMGIDFNVDCDYKFEYGQTFNSFYDEESQDENKNKTLSPHPDTILAKVSSRNWENVTLNKVISGSKEGGAWTDSSIGFNVDGGTEVIADASSINSDANWTPESGNIQLVGGEYYKEALDAGAGMNVDGTLARTDSYWIKIDSKYSSNGNDEENNNTNSPWKWDSLSTGHADVEGVKITYRFAKTEDFDNEIIGAWLVSKDTQDGDCQELSQDFQNPTKITDIDVNSAEDGENLNSKGYTIVVAVKRSKEDTETPDHNTSNSRLRFVGTMFGTQYYGDGRIITSYSGSFPNSDKVPGFSSKASQLANVGDVVFYSISCTLQHGVDLEGEFIFETKTKDGTWSTSDCAPTNNIRKVAAGWGPLDYFVSNVDINPDVIYMDEDQSIWPENGEEAYINFSFDLGAIYEAPDGSKPSLHNDFFYPYVCVTLQSKPINGNTWSNVGSCYLHTEYPIQINGATTRVSGQLKRGQTFERGALQNEGSRIIYSKNTQYRVVVTVNGGNNGTFHGNHKKVLLETAWDNNTAYGYIDVKQYDCKDWTPCKPDVCDTSCKTFVKWGPVTFYFTHCPSDLHDEHEICDDKGNCKTIKDCHPLGCYSWETPKSFSESYSISAQINVGGTGWKTFTGSEEIRAGSSFQIRFITEYSTDRGNMPPPQPWGKNCNYLSRTPGFYPPSAARLIKIRIRNPAGGQEWCISSYKSGWRQIHTTSKFDVPANTTNISVSYELQTGSFKGYWSDREHPRTCLCDCMSLTVKITEPLPIVEGTQDIESEAVNKEIIARP